MRRGRVRVLFILAPRFGAEVMAAWALLSCGGFQAAAGEIVTKAQMFAQRVPRQEALVPELLPLALVALAPSFS